MAKPVGQQLDLLLQAGINPKSGLPIKLGDSGSELKTNIKKLLRVQDEQDAVNRFTWYGLPPELNGHLIERILYYRGQGMFFYMPTNEKFYFLPYALDGTIDVYGQFLDVTPVPFGGGTTISGDKKIKPWINGLRRRPIYEVLSEEENDILSLSKYCVLLRDYTPQYSETVISRQILQEPTLDVMSNLIPFMNTALLGSTNVSGMRVGNEDEASNVRAISNSLMDAALTGKPKIPVIGQVDFQDLSTNTVANSQEYLMAFQSLNNFRLTSYGIPSGGMFQKLGTQLQSEANMNDANTQLVMDDGLYNRQQFCTLLNSIFGLDVWVEESPSLTMAGTPNENQANDLAANSEDSGEEQESSEGEE